MLRHVDVIRRNFYVSLFRTSYTVCRNDCNLTLYEQTTLIVFIVY